MNRPIRSRLLTAIFLRSRRTSVAFLDLRQSLLPSIRMPKQKKSPSQCSNSGAINNKELQGRSGCKLFEDNLIEILSRVPFSSLSRFRFVCKQWLTLITTNSYLAELHVDRGYKSGRPGIIIFSYQEDQLTLMDDEGGHKHIVLELGPLYSRISPCCNGLICLHGRNNHVALFNPSTRQKHVLPRPTIGYDGSSSLCFIGYIPTEKQYKVLRFFHLSMDQNLCEVLTIGTNSWRQITSAEFNQDKRTTTVKFGEPQSGKGVSLNGLMFCIARYSKSDGGKEFGIMSFDFKEEKFGTVQFPMPLTDLDSLSVLEGQLCVAVLRSGCQSMKIWRLEDITGHTWIQIYSVTISPASLMFCHLQPILIHQGKILIKSTEGLHYRNLQTGSKMRTIYQDERMHQSQVHIESAVSLAHL